MTIGNTLPTERDQSPRVMGLLIGAFIATGAAAWAVPLLTNSAPHSAIFDFFNDAVRPGLIILGLLLTAIAITLRPRFALGWAVSSASLAQAALAMPQKWDTIQMALMVASVIALIGAGLVLLPRPLQRMALSLVILFHFGGILVAVTSVPPPYGPAPWLATQMWNRVYRPYFQFMYLFNAYHFYSPDPGPATLVWACVNYSDGTHQWIQMPDRREHMKDPLAVAYYRRLSLTEATNQLMPSTAVAPIALENRSLAGLALGIPTPDRIAEFMPGVAQYRPPTNYTRQLLMSYARRLAINHAPDQPNVAITGIKIYRVTHGLLTPSQVLNGKMPTGPDTYFAYFQGDFNVQGELKDPTDPMLYWFIPMIRITNLPVRPQDAGGEAATDATANYLEIHAVGHSRKGQS